MTDTVSESCLPCQTNYLFGLTVKGNKFLVRSPSKLPLPDRIWLRLPLVKSAAIAVTFECVLKIQHMIQIDPTTPQNRRTLYKHVPELALRSIPLTDCLI